jgi:hypothetical protein
MMTTMMMTMMMTTMTLDDDDDDQPHPHPISTARSSAALDVTRELSTRFPSRHVSHMDLEGATEYLYGVLSALADEANEQDADHDVRVFVEQVTGANGRQVMIFFLPLFFRFS